MARPKATKVPPPAKPTTVAVRMDDVLLAAIDKELDRQRAEHPGRDVKRSDVVREVLYRALVKG